MTDVGKQQRRARKARILTVAFAFVASYLLIICIPRPRIDSSHSRQLPFSALSPIEAPNRREKPLIRIFYNLFIQNAEDEARVLKMFDEQFRAADPAFHDMDNISINSIGYRSASLFQSVAEHRDEGDEDLTLHSLHQYCKANNDAETKVVYLHSKGSFHPSSDNDHLRKFLTEGALSEECANLPPNCDVCSSRMSPHPHPHASGNMWLARCSYVSRLVDPYAKREGKLPATFGEDNGCLGRGRYFFEHWAYSHPSVRPCDLYPGEEYTWAYENIPDVGFEKELKMAPRFDFGVFVKLILEKYWYCREDTRSVSEPKRYYENRMENYRALYNDDFDKVADSWYLRKFLNDSGVDIG